MNTNLTLGLKVNVKDLYEALAVRLHLTAPGRLDPGTHGSRGVAPGRPDPGTHSPGARPGVATHCESRVSRGGSPTPPRAGASVTDTLYAVCNS